MDKKPVLPPDPLEAGILAEEIAVHETEAEKPKDAGVEGAGDAGAEHRLVELGADDAVAMLAADRTADRQHDVVQL